ncbi:bifunctional 2-polyprenyl-6-hydroxyphenol methylase/3-demethylubiquinol 3-O-methyltransferase UbiG [Lewinella sp. W8]|uniref:class I SAM-dependent methyltransferase n=1 Tax=Lewinella sp. W8 TaxID=2528208 RepID=UPI0010684E83|nr:class I SAM-dependent methyltransferase [Lewinella sp. W8]MTB52364.1 methyltransferase domain-containing protein [Lewinella sp. W8]
MTDLERIRHYYKSFDEWGRLDTDAGALELRVVLEVISKYLEPPAHIFDLGGGAGRYTFELAKLGFRMSLGDLSQDLIDVAKSRLMNHEVSTRVDRIAVVNALELGEFPDQSFENVLLFGPLYHLTEASEINQCLAGIYRILKPGGKVFASFIPYHCGIMSIVERSLFRPEQVGSEELRLVSRQGTFRNRSSAGFQEGNYLESPAVEAHFREAGFKKILLRSIRGIGYKNEREILALEESRPEYFTTVMEVLHQTAGELPIVETCGHAMYIGEKARGESLESTLHE